MILFNTKEKFIYTFEFSSALPAGNKAWQRQGRALSLSLNGIKHFHIAKLGGYELDKNREKKSPRLPNPLIPFPAYATTPFSDAKTGAPRGAAILIPSLCNPPLRGPNRDIIVPRTGQRKYFPPRPEGLGKKILFLRVLFFLRCVLSLGLGLGKGEKTNAS